MRTLDRLRALRALSGQPVRTILTLLGIIIGSGAIVLVAGLVTGAEGALIAANQSVSGSDLVEVRSKEQAPRERSRGRPELNRSDATALNESWLGKDRRAHGESSHTTQASYMGRKKYVRFVSGDAGSAALFKLGLAQGRSLNDEDVRLARRVCVVGQEVWQELLDAVPIGPNSVLRADGVLWQVVGVLAPKPLIGSTTGTNIWSRKVMIPETTFDAVYPQEHRVNRILMLGVGAEEALLPLEMLRPSLSRLLLRRHASAKNFELDDANERAMEQTILRVIKLLLIASGVLTLSTGAINVANVMFVSVAERTREIGLRRAMGETQRSLVAQFLLEAATLGLVGGIIGVLSGVFAVKAAGYGLAQVFSAFAVRVEPWSLISGLGLSVLAGIVAGLLPALRAARLDPVTALRPE